MLNKSDVGCRTADGAYKTLSGFSPYNFTSIVFRGHVIPYYTGAAGSYSRFALSTNGNAESRDDYSCAGEIDPGITRILLQSSSSREGIYTANYVFQIVATMSTTIRSVLQYYSTSSFSDASASSKVLLSRTLLENPLVLTAGDPAFVNYTFKLDLKIL